MKEFNLGMHRKVQKTHITADGMFSYNDQTIHPDSDGLFCMGWRLMYKILKENFFRSAPISTTSEGKFLMDISHYHDVYTLGTEVL